MHQYDIDPIRILMNWRSFYLAYIEFRQQRERQVYVARLYDTSLLIEIQSFDTMLHTKKLYFTSIVIMHWRWIER